LGRAGKSAKAPDRYRRYCEEAIREGLSESPWSQIVGQTVLGTEAFVVEMIGKLGKKAPPRKFGVGYDFQEIISAAEKAHGKKWEQFRDSHGDSGRDLVLYLARTECGMSIGELGEQAGIKYQSVATAVRRFAAKAKQDRRIIRLVERTIKTLHNE
jgi:hypothetical protein